MKKKRSKLGTLSYNCQHQTNGLVGSYLVSRFWKCSAKKKKKLMILASLILSLTLFQPGRRAYQVLQDFDVFPRIWTLFRYTLYQR